MYSQSMANLFTPENENIVKDDTSLLLKTYLKDDEPFEEKKKPEEKKSKLFSLFGGLFSKKKSFKVNLESDAAFFYDPQTKQWVNKNEDKKKTFVAREGCAKEKVLPKKVKKSVEKVEEKGSLNSRYAGIKKSGVDLKGMIPKAIVNYACASSTLDWFETLYVACAKYSTGQL